MNKRTLVAAAALGLAAAGCGEQSRYAGIFDATPTPESKLAAAPTPRAPVNTRPYVNAVVNRVIDGDTVDTSAGRVRVLAIDTPEVYGGVECGGPQASARMKQLLPPTTKVRLHSDPGEDDRDRYGRLLRYIYTTRPGLDDVGKELVREGWAEVYLRFPTSKTPAYLKVQAVAKRNHRGMWGIC